MFSKRTFVNYLIILFSFNSFIFAQMRDPFKPVKKVYKEEILLNAILSVDNKKYVSISYHDKNYVLSSNEIIEKIYLIKEIKENELVLLNLETNQEKIVLLHNC